MTEVFEFEVEDVSPNGYQFETTPEEPPEPELKLNKLGKRIYEMYGGAAFAARFWKPNVAMAISQSAEPVAYAWQQWAEESPAIKKFLQSMLEATGVGLVVTAHMPIVLTVASELGFLKKFMNKMETSVA